MLTKEDIDILRSLMKEELQPIKESLADIKEHISEMDDSIGMIADWAEKVADKERIPFASGIN